VLPLKLRSAEAIDGRRRFGHWILLFVIYLKFGACNL